MGGDESEDRSVSGAEEGPWKLWAIAVVRTASNLSILDSKALLIPESKLAWWLPRNSCAMYEQVVASPDFMHDSQGFAREHFNLMVSISAFLKNVYWISVIVCEQKVHTFWICSDCTRWGPCFSFLPRVAALTGRNPWFDFNAGVPRKKAMTRRSLVMSKLNFHIVPHFRVVGEVMWWDPTSSLNHLRLINIFSSFNTIATWTVWAS